MRANRGELFIGTLAFCLVVATAVFMLVTTPSPAHADEAEELFRACGDGFSTDDKARQILNSCNRFIERYSRGADPEQLGGVYVGRGIAKSHFKQYASAVSDYRRAIELGYPLGYFWLGNAYMSGEGVPKDERRAKEIYKKGCDMGSGFSCYFLDSVELRKLVE